MAACLQTLSHLPPCPLLSSPPTPKQAWTPTATVGSVERMKETLCSHQSLLAAPRGGLTAAFSDAPRFPPHRLCHGEGIDVIYPEEPASIRPQKSPMSLPQSRTPQVNLKARRPMVGHHWNRQEALCRIPSSKFPMNVPSVGPPLETSGEPSEGFRVESPIKASKSHESGPTTGLLNWTPKQCNLWWDITRTIKGTI